MNVMCFIPHPIKFRANWHPKVPAPNKSTFLDWTLGMSKVGNNLHFINFIFKSTASLAKLLSSMKDFKSSSTSFFLCLNLFSKGVLLILDKLRVSIYEFLNV